jgi:hypothetical protein
MRVRVGNVCSREREESFPEAARRRNLLRTPRLPHVHFPDHSPRLHNRVTANYRSPVASRVNFTVSALFLALLFLFLLL